MNPLKATVAKKDAQNRMEQSIKEKNIAVTENGQPRPASNGVKKDNFWKIFWSLTGYFVFLGLVALVWLDVSYLNRPDDISRALAVGVTFDPGKDPFESQVRERQIIPLVSGYFYQESIPFGFEDWSWDTETNWRSGKNVYEGSYSAEIKFLKPWSGVRLNSRGMDISSYVAVSLAVFPDQNVGDLYIELHDKYGNSMGKQSMGWYAPNSTLTPNAWNFVIISLENLVPSSKEAEVTGFSISSKESGQVFIDSIHLEKTSLAHSKWKETALSGKWIGSDPFTGIIQLQLPYSLSFSPEDLKFWQPLFGQFELFDDGIHIGPSPQKTNGSMVVFGGGKDWSNYRADVTVYWGMTSTFSLLSRFQDDANFVSCAYSNYGAVVQIYIVKGGLSTLVGQTPGLAINNYEPWKNVKHGMEVKGNRVSCFMENEQVLSATLPNMPETGTIGFETWSKNSEDYPHKVLSFQVRSI